MSDRDKAEEVVFWHLSTAQNALERLQRLIESRHEDLPVQNALHVEDCCRLISEHMEGLDFEYRRLRELENKD
jgi:hypothetical protein